MTQDDAPPPVIGPESENSAHENTTRSRRPDVLAGTRTAHVLVSIPWLGTAPNDCTVARSRRPRMVAKHASVHSWRKPGSRCATTGTNAPPVVGIDLEARATIGGLAAAPPLLDSPNPRPGLSRPRSQSR